MNTNPAYGCDIWRLLSSVMPKSQETVVQSFLQTHDYDITRKQSFPVKTIILAMKEICAQDTVLQTVKSMLTKQDYYVNKSTYVGAMETITFVKQSVGDDMFHWDGKESAKIRNWLACLVVGSTI